MRVNGTDLTALDEGARTRFRREHIGFIFQFFNLIPLLTVEENLLLPLELLGRADARGRAHALALLARVGLADRARTYPDRLSGGEQQRVAVARALVHDPALVLADEPTGNLDADAAKVVLDLLDGLARELGKTVVMATHSREVIGVADRVFLIQQGQLVEQSAVAGPRVSRLLWRASLRHLLRHPGQIGLSVLGIALGVAVALSIDLATESARRAFALATEAVTGRATHQIVGGPAGLPEAFYRTPAPGAGRAPGRAGGGLRRGGAGPSRAHVPAPGRGSLRGVRVPAAPGGGGPARHARRSRGTAGHGADVRAHRPRARARGGRDPDACAWPGYDAR